MYLAKSICIESKIFLLQLQEKQTVKRFEVFDINVGMRGRHSGHIYTIEHNWNNVVGQNLPVLLCEVVLQER